MKDILIVGSLIFVFVLGLVSGGFYLGYQYNEGRWRTLVPPEMDKLCQECAEIGLTKGKKEGYKQGVGTCDDVIDSINAQGRR